MYADFLDDHDQPVRAEFIRLQCEIARLEVGPRAVVDANWRLWKRQQDLLDDHLPEVLGPAALLAGFRPGVHRGFVGAVVLPVGEFVRTGGRVADLLPLPQVAVTNVAADHPGFFQSPHLGCVAAATVYDPDAMTDEVCLEVAAGFREHAHRLAHLTDLHLGGCGVNDVAMADLAVAALPALGDLDLTACFLSDAGVVALLNGPLARQLTRLVLDFNFMVGDQAAFELADRLGKVPTFRTLDFRHTRVTSAGQAALTAAFGSRCNLF